MSQSPIAADDADLRSDVRRLGDLLGQTLVRQEGPELLALVEEVRKAVREGSGAEILAQLSVEDSVQLVRAFSTYFHLANVAEQVHRARVLAEARATGGSWLARAVDRIEAALKSPNGSVRCRLDLYLLRIQLKLHADQFLTNSAVLLICLMIHAILHSKNDLQKPLICYGKPMNFG
jgi:phosphoenolpyruvate carboxylase